MRQRLYRGRCVNNRHVEASLREFKDAREAIETLVDNQEGLSPYVRKDVARYIDDFFDLINDPRDVQNKIIEDCI